MNEIDNIKAHIERLVAVVRNATLRRVVHDIDPDPQLNFWRVNYGNLTNVVVIEWCKTFGTDNEDGHWKNVVTDPDSFRAEMLSQMRIDRVEWEKYWGQMKHYRDTVAVHAGHSAEGTDYPRFDIALESVFFYYQYLIRRLRDLGVGEKPDDLRGYAQSFEAQARKAAKAALRATADIPETAY